MEFIVVATWGRYCRNTYLLQLIMKNEVTKICSVVSSYIEVVLTLSILFMLTMQNIEWQKLAENCALGPNFPFSNKYTAE